MDEILLDRSDGGVVTVTLNRPRVKNAMAGDMWEELRRILQQVKDTEGDRVLLLTGAGGDFCSGAELSRDVLDTHALNAMNQVNATALALHQVSKPTIAKVRGACIGGGMNLALGCDLIVAGETARFSEIFARRGLSLDVGGSWLLPRLVGMHKAKELALLTDILDAAEAERIGIVNRVLPDGELDAFVDDWAKRLADGPPLALQMTKKMLSNAFSVGLSEALDAEAAAQSVNFASEDTREGFEAFLEKRPPVFKGR